MIEAGEKVKMTVDLAVEWQDKDPMGYNTVAEIPGSDLKDEIVMLGGHMDSWHSGTGATDNGAGVAVAMEAMRILRALNKASYPIDQAELDRQLRYLTSKGWITEVEKGLRPDLRRWESTAEGDEYLMTKGLN